MPPTSPSSIHWPGLPRYRLPRIRLISQASLSIIYDSPSFAAHIVFRSPLEEAFERTRQAQQMRARRLHVARSQAAFPNLAIYRRRSVKDTRVIPPRRKVTFPHRRTESTRTSLSSKGQRRTSRTSGQSRQERRVTAQLKLITSRASLRRAVSERKPPRSTSTTRGSSSPQQSTSTRSSGLFREPSTRSVPGLKRLPHIQIQKSRSLKSRTPRRLASPAPYWGAIASPILGERKPALDRQTFVSRRVDGKFVHQPLPLIKQSANDVLHRGLSNSSRKSRIYDKRLPTRKTQAEIHSKFIVLPDARAEFPLLFPSSLDFAKLDGSSAGRSSSSSSQMIYPDEDSSSNIVNAASRTTSEARALDDFTQGLQQHLTTTYANPRPRSPSVAQTVVSTHTLQDLVAFREEFTAAGLAVTSRDQKGNRNQRQSERSAPPKIKAQQFGGPRARRQSMTAASTAAPPRTAFSTLNVPTGVESKSPRTASPLVQGDNPALIGVQSTTDQQTSTPEKSKIPIPREKPAPKKPLPWTKKSELSAIPFRAPFPIPSEAPSRATNNSSVATTIIDFSPHPSEFWKKQGLDFSDFQDRHPGLGLEPDFSVDYNDVPDSEIIMLENEIKAPTAVAAPEQPRPQQYFNQNMVIHDKSPPPKPLRIEVFERANYHTTGGHRAPSPLQTQLFPEDINEEYSPDSTDLVRADSFEELKDENPNTTNALPTIPDFSSFVTSSGSVSDYRRRSTSTRPKSAGDERGMDPPILGRRASKEEIWAEKRRRSKEDFLKQARNQMNQYDEQRTKFEIKKVTPWELPSDSNNAEVGSSVAEKAKALAKSPKSADEHPTIEIIGAKSDPPQRDGKPSWEMDGAAQSSDKRGIFKHGKLSDLKSKMRGLFSTDRESRSSGDDELSLASPPLISPPSEPYGRPKMVQEKEREQDSLGMGKPTIVVPECEECRNAQLGLRPPGTGASARSGAGVSTGRPSSLNEPKSARSFQEWQAGVPFKPLSRESSLNDRESAPEDVLPCGHARKPRVGDPVKRIVAARRTKPAPSITGTSRAPSIFTIQETVPKAAPKIMPAPQAMTKKPTVVEAENDEEISDGAVLKGLGIVMEGILNEDVQAWIKEVTGTNVRRFLGDLAAMDRLGTGALADVARRNARKRMVAVERLEFGKGKQKEKEKKRKMGRSEGSAL